MAAAPSYWDKIRKYFLGGHEPESPHLHIAKEPPKIRKALAIGVHGYFPAAILQKVLGPPTGTSIRFANAAAEAVERWTLSQGYRCETEKIALEGEGFVGDRVDTLWKLLLNWIDHIRNADFILVACHSQGVPVAIMLVAKLIQFGCVNAARIGVCAMAGVNLGPFPEYRSRFFGGSAGELFEFSRPNSTVSQKYQGALRVVLNYGVRIVYVGSIDDQLVSLEVSLLETPVPIQTNAPRSRRPSPTYRTRTSTDPSSSTAASTPPTSSRTWWASCSSCATWACRTTG